MYVSILYYNDKKITMNKLVMLKFWHGYQKLIWKNLITSGLYKNSLNTPKMYIYVTII